MSQQHTPPLCQVEPTEQDSRSRTSRPARWRIGFWGFLGFAGVAVAGFGASCPNIDLNSESIVEITRGNSVVWRRYVSYFSVVAWAPGALSPASADQWPDKSSEANLIAAGPRQFYIMNTYTGPGDYDTVSDKRAFAVSTPNYTVDAPWIPQSARLVDHGQCRVAYPLTAQPNPNAQDAISQSGGLFYQIATSLKSQVIAQMADGGAGQPVQTASYWQVRWSSPQVNGYFGQPVDDGFSFFANFTANNPCPLDLCYTPTIDIHASYAFTFVKGFPNIEFRWANPYVHVPKSNAQATVDEITTKLQNDLAPQVMGTLLYGTAKQAGVSDATPVPCVGQFGPNGDAFCASSQAVKDYVRFGLKSAVDGGQLTAQDADNLVSSLSPNDFICGLRTADSPDPTDTICRVRPSFERMVVLPDKLELIWYEENETPTPEYNLVKYTTSTPSVLGTCGIREYMPADAPADGSGNFPVGSY